ncbi:MAG: molybdopterin-synthase adenylyltransferase MoeB [Proteobacteria bacterium]|nr:MAG: molybdopterin-synthase adenylyltransferase MoeB [Pseudomonadota bacterium]QKK11348.1 MAG: molybdopterin-synthase adenylyltransferase MoeB [Pseudomonadota bacterium]
MDDAQLLRYNRQMMLPQVDFDGQQRLVDSHALIVGAGGLGSPVAMYLAAAGVGQITLVDFDTVDLSNLQRQILHATDDVGRLKVESGRDTLLRINPLIDVVPIAHRLEGDALRTQVEQAHVVIDASDNFATRFQLNDICWTAGKPLVSGAAIRFEGQVTVFDPRVADSPCYRCLYRDENEPNERCSETGVFTPVVGMIGTTQAAEALKLLIGVGEPLIGRLLLLDVHAMEWRSVRLRKDPHCPLCAAAGKEKPTP